MNHSSGSALTAPVNVKRKVVGLPGLYVPTTGEVTKPRISAGVCASAADLAAFARSAFAGAVAVPAPSSKGGL
jgi:hypothetical protein